MIENAFLLFLSHGINMTLEGPAQAHMQALNFTGGMCAPAMAWPV
jgi:hypothetical protein